MQVTLIYFSQTGNTRKVAEAMAEILREKGDDTRTIPLKVATPQDVVGCDLLGLGTPCFSSQAPTPVKAFISSLPDLKKQTAFVFATSGGAPGRVLFDLYHGLQSRGAEVKGGFLARGEIHYPAPSLVGRFRNRPDAADLSAARRFAVGIAEHVAAGRPGIMAEGRLDTFRPQGWFYNLVAWLTTDNFVRRSLPEPKLDLDRCSQCQWCADECPMGNISLQPYPVLGNKCIRCYRCLTGCPENAFQVNWAKYDPGLWLIYNATFERWFGDVKRGEEIYPK